jgi:hypothetical protein
MLPGLPESASCVQRFDDSLNSAIRITYRISLRSSSVREPRYPLLRVVRVIYISFKDELRHTTLEHALAFASKRPKAMGFARSLISISVVTKG